jgi:hypothetical protein
MTVLSIFSKNNLKMIFLDKNDNALKKYSKNGIREKCSRLTVPMLPYFRLSDRLMVHQKKVFGDRKSARTLCHVRRTFLLWRI